jgi:hypothetical protein
VLLNSAGTILRGDGTVTEEPNRASRIDVLTSSIREMASRVNAEFVPDNRKSAAYGAASDRTYGNLPSDPKKD